SMRLTAGDLALDHTARIERTVFFVRLRKSGGTQEEKEKEQAISFEHWGNPFDMRPKVAMEFANLKVLLCSVLICVVLRLSGGSGLAMLQFDHLGNRIGLEPDVRSLIDLVGRDIGLRLRLFV